MKILYLSKAVLPSKKAHSLSIMRMCQAFADCGHKVLLSGAKPSDNAPDPVEYYGLRGGFKVIRKSEGLLSRHRVTRKLLLPGLKLAWETRELPYLFKPDIIYSRLTLQELAFVPANLPIVYEMHSLGKLGKSEPQKLLFRLLRKTKNFRRIVVTTRTLADILSKELPGVEITVTPLSAELPENIPQKDLEHFNTTIMKGKSFNYHIGYTGSLNMDGLRGTDIICKAAEKIPEAAFHIVGGEREMVEYWKAFAEQYNCNKNIFLYGYRKSGEIPFFLKNFHVVLAPLQCRPSKRAPAGNCMSPLKIPQYMSYGKCIVASDIPAHSETLVNNETAILIDESDLDNWVSTLKYLLSNKDRRHELGDRARSLFEKRLTPTSRVKKILRGLY